MDIRDKARIYLLQVPPHPAQITSVGPTASLFTKLSGINQLMLEQSWGLKPRPKKSPSDPDVFRADPPPGLTSCNGFVGIYGNANGIAQPGKSLGQFNLDKKVASFGRGFSWVNATPGARPKFGDIFELNTRLHQGVSLDFIGDTWFTAEGGQGGKSMGFDIIKQKKADQTGDILKNEKGETLKGWVDIDLFVNGPPPTTVPQFLLGWWSVPWRGRVFFYFIEADFKASWTFQKPVSDSMLPFKFDDTATLTMDGHTSLTLKWSKTGSIEKFRQGATEDQLIGAWNGVEPLIATKMF